MRVIVVGGGISGLTMALSLHQAGIPVTVYEAAREVRPLGVGINLLPHAVRELTELGLGDAPRRDRHTRPKRSRSSTSSGSSIWREPRGLAAGYHWPQYSIHRGQLQRLLLETVRERLGADSVRTGCRLLSFRQEGETVVRAPSSTATAASAAAIRPIS